MGLFDSIKDIMSISDEDDFDEEEEFEEEAPTPKKAVRERSYERDYEERREPRRERAEAPKIIRGRAAQNKNQQTGGSMQVVLVKPDRFDDVTSIADHLNAGKTVVLNLEEATADISRRIVDFLSGAAYANGGNMRKVAKNTFIIVASGVDVMGELMLEEFDENKLYF